LLFVLLMLTTEILIQHHGLFQKYLPNFPSEIRTKRNFPTSQLLSIYGNVVEVSLNGMTFIPLFVKIDQLVPKLKGGTLHARMYSMVTTKTSLLE